MLEETLRLTSEYRRLRDALSDGRTPAALFGMPPAARAQVAAALAADLGRPVVVLTATEAAAARFAADAAFFGARSEVCPARDFACGQRWARATNLNTVGWRCWAILKEAGATCLRCRSKAHCSALCPAPSLKPTP